MKKNIKWTNRISTSIISIAIIVIFLIALLLFFNFNVRQSNGIRAGRSIQLGQNPTHSTAVSMHRPDKLVISRHADPPDNLSAFTLTITDASQVKKLYEDIYVLPTLFPNEKCPEGGHILYSLAFYQNNNLIDTAVFSNVGGCVTVSLDSAARLVAQEPFISDFQKATGLSRKAVIGY